MENYLTDRYMKYDFDEMTERLGTGCVKWDMAPAYGGSLDGVIPMWVADMDFKVAPCITEALSRRLQHGVFGYVYVPESYYESTIAWFARRRGWNIRREWIQFIPGLVPAISMVVKALTQPGDKVIFNSPAYNCFYSRVSENGREVVESPLVKVDGRFRMDFEDIARKCADPRARIFLLCNPHNPAGRVWEADELAELGRICREHDVLVVSDEIHCELEMPGHRFTPFASISKENEDCSITFNSPSKAFNLAGLQISNIICSNPEWLAAIKAVMHESELDMVNPFGVDALQAAYTEEGEEWLHQLNEYLFANFTYLRETVGRELPGFEVTPLEGTYLAWMDCAPLKAKGVSTMELERRLFNDHGVRINSGKIYGDEGFVRINLATQASRCREGIDRMVAGIKEIMNQ